MPGPGRIARLAVEAALFPFRVVELALEVELLEARVAELERAELPPSRPRRATVSPLELFARATR